MSGEPKTLTLEKRRESAAATILRHLQAGPATVVELMDRIHADTTRPEVGTPGWRIVTTHLVADTLSAVEALGDLLGQKFLSRDERGVIALTLPLGVPVVARDEASDNEGVDLEHCACCGQQFDANHLDHDTLTCQNCISAAVDLYYSQGEAAELRAALRTLVTDLEALMEESHLSLYDGDGALVDTSWGKVLQGGKDEYLGNWNEAKRLAGGENEK